MYQNISSCMYKNKLKIDERPKGKTGNHKLLEEEIGRTLIKIAEVLFFWICLLGQNKYKQQQTNETQLNLKLFHSKGSHQQNNNKNHIE